ncbi:3'5'-cyclic nucleotide phosphodiesterase, partial [Globisporangium splendens]
MSMLEATRTHGIASPRRTKRDPRISNTSLQDIRFELEVLEQVESSQQTWSLRFKNKPMEARFQLYHEEVSLWSSRVACGCTLLGLLLMQSGSFYDIFVVVLPDIRQEMDTTHWAFVYFANNTAKPCASGGKLQAVLFLFGVCVVLVVLVQPAYALHFHNLAERGLANASAFDGARQSHQLTKMITLASEQDLFMENRMKRRRMTQSQVDAEAGGWLSLIEEQKHRRRKSCDMGIVLNVPVNPMLSLLSTDKWTSKKLLAGAARSEEFDLLGFAKVCMFPLTSIFLTTLESHNLFVELPIRIECAAKCGLEIESRYQAKNPYHNAVHAASVVWDINFFLRHLQQPVTPLQIFSALVAGAVHDVNHPGMNNAYLVNANSPLAIKYSDDSVLERMHLAEAFQAATKEGCDIFEAFPKDAKRQSRQQIIKMVLATDLSGHLKHVNRLKSKRYAIHSTSSSDLMITPSCAPPVPILPDDLVFHSIIMMADLDKHADPLFVFVVSRPRDEVVRSYFAWSKLVTEEFYRQGDTERQFGMPISPLCDRFNCKFEKNQIGFLDFIVLPLYSAVNEVLVFEGFGCVLARI